MHSLRSAATQRGKHVSNDRNSLVFMIYLFLGNYGTEATIAVEHFDSTFADIASVQLQEATMVIVSRSLCAELKT